MIDKLMKIVINAFAIVSFIGIILCILTMGGYIPPIYVKVAAGIAWPILILYTILMFLSNKKKK